MAKDLGPGANALREARRPTELGLRAAEFYADFAASVGDKQDFSGIVRTIGDRRGERA